MIRANKKKPDAAPEKQVELLTKAQVAEKLKISTRSMYRMLQAGDIPPAIKIGRVLRWRSDVLNEWVENDCPNLS